MATKRCSYKGCRSVTTPDIPSTETFFQFPKDETRYDMWMTLSKCEDKCTKGIKYLCSKHFDHNKYMSTNPRRKLLLTTAIPYAHQSDNEDNAEESEEEQDVVSTQYEEEEYYTVRGDIVDEPTEQVSKDDDDIGYAESTEETETAQVEIVDQSDYDKTLPQTKLIKKVKVDNLSIYRKRKIQEESTDAQNYKILQIRPVPDHKRPAISIRASPREAKSPKLRTEFTEEDLITDPSVTSFIFKNEEYVQMPKKLYVEEKVELLRELQYYKDIVINFKNLVDTVKI